MVTLNDALRPVFAAAAALSLAACASQTELGEGSSLVTGSAGAAGAKNSAPQLRRCERSLGAAALVEPKGDSTVLLTAIGLQSPVPLLRLIMAQSNCFLVVDRGAALSNIQTERELAEQGMVEGPGQPRLVAARYLITPNVVFSNRNAGGAGVGALLGVFGLPGAVAGAAIASMRIQEAQAALFLTDAQTGVQIAVAEGSAKVKDFGGGAGLGGWGGGVAGIGGIGGYGNTAEGKLIAAALLNAYNNLTEQVMALQESPPS